MKKLLDRLILSLSSLRLLPHLILLKNCSHSEIIRADILRWHDIIYKTAPTDSISKIFLKLMTYFPEYRNLFYYRTGWKGKLLGPLCQPMSTLFIRTPRIGPGLFIQHGFATIIAAREIGDNCFINQQVTVGYSNATDAPTISNNVTISAGAKVIGGIHIGENVKIGANAVVVKNVPANVTVVGVPGRIVKRDGKRVNESL